MAGERLLEQLRVAREAGDDAAGQVGLAFDVADSLDRLSQRHVGREIERNRHRRLLGLPVDLQRTDAPSHRRDFVERNQLPAGGGDADASERVGVVLEIFGGLEDHLIIVGFGEDGRNLSRAIGVVERGAHLIGGDAEGRRLVAVDVDAGPRIGDLQVCVDVAQARELRDRALQLRRFLVQRIDVAGLQRVLVIRSGDASARELEVLHREQKGPDAGNHPQ